MEFKEILVFSLVFQIQGPCLPHSIRLSPPEFYSIHLVNFFTQNNMESIENSLQKLFKKTKCLGEVENVV